MAHRKKRKMKGVTHGDVISSMKLAITQSCERKWKTKQYKNICIRMAKYFGARVRENGTTRDGLLKSAQQTNEHCMTNYKPQGKSGRTQYRDVCLKIGPGFITHLERMKPGLEGRRRKRR